MISSLSSPVVWIFCMLNHRSASTTNRSWDIKISQAQASVGRERLSLIQPVCFLQWVSGRLSWEWAAVRVCLGRFIFFCIDALRTCWILLLVLGAYVCLLGFVTMHYAAEYKRCTCKYFNWMLWACVRVRHHSTCEASLSHAEIRGSISQCRLKISLYLSIASAHGMRDKISPWTSFLCASGKL